MLSNRNKTRHLQLQMKGSLVISVLLTRIDLDVYNSLEKPKNAFVKTYFDKNVQYLNITEWQQNNSSPHYHEII